jgi:hypothetical protein
MLKAKVGWSHKFEDPIALPDGREPCVMPEGSSLGKA